MLPHVRIVFKGHPGEPRTPPFALHLNAQAAWDKARTVTGGTRGLRLYGTKGSNSDKAAVPAIGPAYRAVYTDTYNDTSDWTASVIANAAYFEQLPHPFNSPWPGVHYLYSGASAARFISNFTIAENHGFTWRGYLFRPPQSSANPRQIVQLRFGTPGAPPSPGFAYKQGWLFEFYDGKTLLHQLAETWSQATQTLYDALRVKASLSSGQQTTADGYAATLFQKTHELDLGLSAEALYNNAFEIAFICEARGRLHIIVTGAGEATVECPEILATRRIGALWNDTPLVISTTGGEMFWQIGSVSLTKASRLTMPSSRWMFQDALSTVGLLHRGQYDAAQTGATLAFDVDESNSLYPQIYADFTSDGSDAAWLYTVASFAPAGERTGDDDVFLDTDNHLDSSGVAWITKFVPACEDEQRRMKLEVTLDNPNNMLGLWQCGLELNGRRADVYLGDDLWLGEMTVRDVNVGPLTSMHGGADEWGGDTAPIARTETLIDFTLVDLETMDEEDLMIDDPILDGMTLGAALRLVYQGGGAPLAEIAGIDEDAGPILDSAALGEAPAVRPSEESPRSDFVNFLMDTYGIGYTLDTFTGVRTLAALSSLSVIELEEDEIEELEATRDYRDTSNIIPFKGANDLARNFTILESYRAPDFRGYLGRPKRCASVRDEGRRTAGSVETGARSVARLKGKPGNFAAFKYAFDTRLLPKRPFKFPSHDTVYEIERIEPDDQTKAETRMRIIGREKIAVA